MLAKNAFIVSSRTYELELRKTGDNHQEKLDIWCRYDNVKYKSNSSNITGTLKYLFPNN